MLMDAKRARQLTAEGRKIRKIAEEVDDRIRASAKLGYGYINASPAEIDALGEFLLDSGYTINGTYVIWDDGISDNKKEEEDDEDEW